MAHPPAPIKEHGLIGNMRAAALVNARGSIDFFCFPEFDSPTVFAALLDRGRGGHFSIAPQWRQMTTQQLYIPETNLLLTRFLSESGMVEITDFMAITPDRNCHGIFRSVTVLDGEATMHIECAPRFNYAAAEPRARHSGDAIVFTPPDSKLPAMQLYSSVKLKTAQGAATGQVHLGKGEAASFLFGTGCAPPPGKSLAEFVGEQARDTANFWKQWSAKSTYTGRWRERVNRSALVLKMLSSRQYGSIIAAPTFGLPEEIGGQRNWDYRYTWLRDASFSLYAMVRLGYVDEARSFIRWMRDRLQWKAEHGPLQVMYRCDGGQELDEESLRSFAGYQGSKPVRIGNAASRQFQLDIYGEVFDAIYLASKYGDGISHQGWQNMKRILKWLEKNWRQPDEGIWEVRGGRREFLHSRLMCWVAFDRAARLGRKRSLEGPFGWMEDARDAIVNDIHSNFYSDQLGCFVQYKGAKEVDASVLLMGMMRFISPTDPRWLATLAAVERELVTDARVLRYRGNSGVDGLPGEEGSFNACSFWYIEALARSHQVEKAHVLMEKMLAYCNQAGLYSEELGENGEFLGNFPQALTHLAFISAATYLDRRLSSKGHEPWS